MRNLWLLFIVGLATGFISEKLFVTSLSPLLRRDDLYLEGQTSGDLPIDDEDGENDGSGSGSGDDALTDLTDQEEKLLRFLNFTRTTEIVPNQPQPTADSPDNQPTTAVDSQDPSTTVKDTETTPSMFPDEDSSVEKMTDVVPAADWFTQSTTNMPPRETTETRSDIDISITEGTEEDNSLDVSTTKASREEIPIKDVENEIVAKDGKGSRMFEVQPPKEVTSENLWERTEVLAAVIACGVVGFLCAVFLLLLLAYRMKKKDEGSYDLGDTKNTTTAYHKAPTKEFYA